MRRLAEKDKCLTRLKTELKEAEAQSLPTRGEIEAAKKKLQLAHQELLRLQSAKEQRGATVRMCRAQIFQRLTTIAEKEEARRVRAIRSRIAPEFRT